MDVIGTEKGFAFRKVATEFGITADKRAVAAFFRIVRTENFWALIKGAAIVFVLTHKRAVAAFFCIGCTENFWALVKVAAIVFVPAHKRAVAALFHLFRAEHGRAFRKVATDFGITAHKGAVTALFRIGRTEHGRAFLEFTIVRRIATDPRVVAAVFGVLWADPGLRTFRELALFVRIAFENGAIGACSQVFLALAFRKVATKFRIATDEYSFPAVLGILGAKHLGAVGEFAIVVWISGQFDAVAAFFDVLGTREVGALWESAILFRIATELRAIGTYFGIGCAHRFRLVLDCPIADVAQHRKFSNIGCALHCHLVTFEFLGRNDASFFAFFDVFTIARLRLSE